MSHHRGRIRAGGWNWYLGGLAIVAALFGFGKAIAGSGPESASSLALTALAALGAGVALLIVPVLRWRQTVHCFDRGIVWQRLIGDKRIPRESISDVELIYHRGKYTHHDEIKISLGQRSVSIVGIENPEQIVNIIRAWLRNPQAAQATGHYGWTPPAS